MLDHQDSVRSASDIVELISDMPKSTDKFKFLKVEEFGEISRVGSKESDEIYFKDILKIHSIKTVPGGLLAHQETCTSCTPSSLCRNCQNSAPTIAIDEDDTDESEGEGEDETVNDDDVEISDTDSDTDDDPGNSDINFGSVVWAKYCRTWYPAKVVSASELPSSLKSKLPHSGLIPVKWYRENQYSLVYQRNLDTLAQNRVDEARASVSEQMLIKYNEALSDVQND